MQSSTKTGGWLDVLARVWPGKRRTAAIQAKSVSHLGEASEWDELVMSRSSSRGLEADDGGDGLDSFDEDMDWAEAPEKTNIDQWSEMQGDLARGLAVAERLGPIPEVDEVGVATACIERMLASGIALDAIAEAMIIVEDSGVRRSWEAIDTERRARVSKSGVA